MNVTKNYELISNSQNPLKIMFFTPKKRSHSASSAYNVKKGTRCNYITNMKALAHKNANLPSNLNWVPTQVVKPSKAHYSSKN